MARILRPLLCTPAYGCVMEYTGPDDRGHPIRVRFQQMCQRHATLVSDILVHQAICDETDLEEVALAAVRRAAPTLTLGTLRRTIDMSGVLTVTVSGAVNDEALTAIRREVSQHPRAGRIVIQ